MLVSAALPLRTELQREEGAIPLWNERPLYIISSCWWHLCKGLLRYNSNEENYDIWKWKIDIVLITFNKFGNFAPKVPKSVMVWKGVSRNCVLASVQQHDWLKRFVVWLCKSRHLAIISKGWDMCGLQSYRLFYLSICFRAKQV